MAKKSNVVQYINDAILLIRDARPSGFRPTGQIRISYDFALGRDADCDNMIKVINDAIAIALEINDRWFLPCVNSKRVSKESPGVWVHFADLGSAG